MVTVSVWQLQGWCRTCQINVCLKNEGLTVFSLLENSATPSALFILHPIALDYITWPRTDMFYPTPRPPPPLPPPPAFYKSRRQTTVVLMKAKKSCKLTSVSISIFWPSRAPVARRCGGQLSIIGPHLISERGAHAGARGERLEDDEILEVREQGHWIKQEEKKERKWQNTENKGRNMERANAGFVYSWLALCLHRQSRCNLCSRSPRYCLSPPMHFTCIHNWRCETGM